jgi:CBS domain-containing protein
MSTSVVTVTENDSIEKVLELILRYDINRIPVVKDRKPVGIVARRDLLRVMKVNQTGATLGVGAT